MLSNISCFIDLNYAFIALVMLLFQPSSTVCHTYNCAEDYHEKALYTCTKYVIYNIQAICIYLVDVRALIC